jgi:hypothetical protein
MATLSDIRAGIRTRLATIAGLNVYDYLPDNPATPGATVAPLSGTFVTYNTTFDGNTEWTLGVLVIVPNAVDHVSQDALDTYLQPTGASSVKAAIDAGFTLGGVAYYAVVTEARNYGTVTINETPYAAVEFVVMVTAE